MLVSIVILFFVLCFSIYEWWFRHSRYHHMTKAERDNKPFYSKPLAWALLSLALFLILLSLIGYNLYRLMELVVAIESMSN